ncbi:MAG: hypothetical protein N3B13_07415 [Deltaproteobacteria bacterium]|nr:hypothetical protein [Deltaproteobacteria bacterium]
MMKRYLALFLIALVSISLVYSSEENLKISRDDGNLYLSVKINVKNQKELQKRLSSGLSNKIIISVQGKDRKNNNPVFSSEYIFEAVYDVWDEKYRLYLLGPQKNLILETENKEEIYMRFLTPRNLRICETKILSPESSYNVKVRIVINPVSKDIIEKIKEYLADPEMTGKGSPTRTIFGSFANTFIPDLNTENIIKYEIKSIGLSDIPVEK